MLGFALLSLATRDSLSKLSLSTRCSIAWPLFKLSLGLAHDWLRFGIAKTSFALHSPCTIIVSSYSLNTYIARYVRI